MLFFRISKCWTMGARKRALLLCVLIILVVGCFIRFFEDHIAKLTMTHMEERKLLREDNNAKLTMTHMEESELLRADNISKLILTHKEESEGSFKRRPHYNCLNELQDVIDKDAEDNLVLPKGNILLSLRLNVLDCLYQRYTTNLQTYCYRQDKHGSCSGGWNLCVDGCYKPNSNTVIRVISDTRTPYKDTRLQSLINTYQSRVVNYALNSTGQEIYLQKVKLNGTSNQTESKDGSFIDDVNRLKGKDDVLIIDVGIRTKQAMHYILENILLTNFKQISFRTQYLDSNKSQIDYVSALYHLSQLYKHGFRIYWYQMELDCMLKGDIYRTSCVTINLIHKECGQKNTSENQKHLLIPDDKTLLLYNKDEEAVFYQRYLTSIQTHCKEIVRLGGIKDGGWEVCNDEKYRPKQPCLVYSFGINFDFKFDDAVADAYGCEVHSFDPSMKKNDFQRSRHVSFHNLGLLDEIIERDVKTGWKLSTLKNIRENLGHTKRKLDIIKIDIENSEWKALPEMIQSGALQDVSQIFLEFHSIGNKIHLKILRLLYNEGFRIFWYHRNPSCCIKDKLIEYSRCNEVYFVRE